MSLELADRLRHRPPWPFDFRAADDGLVGSTRLGFTGDVDDGNRIRLRARSGQLLEVFGNGGPTVAGQVMPSGFPALDSTGLVVRDAAAASLACDWPWTPARMIGEDGFTVLVELTDNGTIDRADERQVFNFGEAGNRVANVPSFELYKANVGMNVYRARMNHPNGPFITPSNAFAPADVPNGSRLAFLAGVQRNEAGQLVAFLDVYVDGVRLAGAPFVSGPQAKPVPAAWQDQRAGIGARPNGSGRADCTFHRIAWDRGVHTGAEGLQHFGATA